MEAAPSRSVGGIEAGGVAELRYLGKVLLWPSRKDFARRLAFSALLIAASLVITAGQSPWFAGSFAVLFHVVVFLDWPIGHDAEWRSSDGKRDHRFVPSVKRKGTHASWNWQFIETHIVRFRTARFSDAGLGLLTLNWDKATVLLTDKGRGVLMRAVRIEPPHQKVWERLLRPLPIEIEFYADPRLHPDTVEAFVDHVAIGQDALRIHGWLRTHQV